MRNLKKLVTVRCVEEHGTEDDSDETCSKFVVDLFSEAVKGFPATEDDMQHLDDPGEICDKSCQAINQALGILGTLRDEPPVSLVSKKKDANK